MMRHVAFGIILLSFLYGGRADSQPRLVLSATVWEVGTIAQGDTASWTLVLYNKGDGLLTIRSVQSTCPCLMVEVSPHSIAPEDSMALVLRFMEPRRLGRTTKTLYIGTNDPEQPRARVRVTGVIVEAGYIPAVSPRALSSEEGLFMPTTGDTVVGVSLFISEDCDDCEAVKETLIPQLERRFGRAFQIQYHVIENEEEYDLMVALEEQLGQGGHDIPMAVVGRYILGGRQALTDSLAVLISMVLAQGGAGFPTVGEVERPAVSASNRRIYMAYFYTPGCKECDRVMVLLRYVERRYPNVEIQRYSIGDRENVALLEAIGERYGVPEAERLLTPSLFIGDVHLVEHAITDRRVWEVLNQVQATGTRCPWEDAEAIRGQAEGLLMFRFRSLGPWAVTAAGLIDGVNPCAFTTLVFFVSYLSLVGRRGRDLVLVGAAFTVAVFLTYFLVGIGVFHFIQSLHGFSLLSRILYMAIAVLALTLGILSFHDFIKARRGEIREATLQLPTFLKRRIHQTIRTHVRVRRFVLAAFASGMVVSLLELACTGQVYLPTICFVVGVPAMRAHAVLYLGLYNLMFVVPLIVVFVLAYLGVSSGRLAEWTQRHVALVKLLISLLFFALGGLLISTVV